MGGSRLNEFANSIANPLTTMSRLVCGESADDDQPPRRKQQLRSRSTREGYTYPLSFTPTPVNFCRHVTGRPRFWCPHRPTVRLLRLHLCLYGLYVLHFFVIRIVLTARPCYCDP